MLPEDDDALLSVDPATLSPDQLRDYAARLEAALHRIRRRREMLLRISASRTGGAAISVTPAV